MQSPITIISVLLAVLVVGSVHGDGQRHCGHHLNDMMAFVCEGKFQGVFDKRSGVAKTTAGRLIDAHHAEQRPFYETLPFAWEAMRIHQLTSDQPESEDDAILAADGQHRFRRSASAKLDWYLHQNIVEECCDNPCTLKQMMAYCRV